MPDSAQGRRIGDAEREDSRFECDEQTCSRVHEFLKASCAAPNESYRRSRQSRLEKSINIQLVDHFELGRETGEGEGREDRDNRRQRQQLSGNLKVDF